MTQKYNKQIIVRNLPSSEKEHAELKVFNGETFYLNEVVDLRKNTTFDLEYKKSTFKRLGIKLRVIKETDERGVLTHYVLYTRK